MKKEDISVLSNVLIAISTFIGVCGTTAVYLNQFQNTSTIIIILVEIIYVILTLLILSWIKGGME